MWIEVRRLCEAVQNFEERENSTDCAELIKEIEKFKWRIQNILKNQGKSSIERVKLKADAEISIDGVKVPLDQALCDETIIISDIFNLNEMDALELVLSGWPFGNILDFGFQVRTARTSSQFQRGNRVSYVVAAARERFGRSQTPDIANTAAAVLSNFVKEIRNETVWSDQSVCGTAQLACAIALRSLAVSPADHLNITNVEVDVDKVVDRAVRNMAMLFIRHGVIGSDYFKQCCTHVRVVDALLKQLIALFPAKLMEIERNSEDELTWVDEMSEKGQQATPALHYENLLRCITDLYQIVDDPKASESVKSYIVELSIAFSSSGSMELCRFIERARLPHHVVHAVAYLDLLCAICRTRQVAAFIFDVFARVPAHDEGYVGWDHVMSALRSYERLFRERPGGTSMFGHSLSQQQPKAVIPPRELIGMITWINLSRIVIGLDEEAAEVFLEERQWAVLDAALGVVSAPVPLSLKGALLRLIAALAKREASANRFEFCVVYENIQLYCGSLRIWTALNAHQLCTFAENGTLLGLQKELEERECTEEMFDASLGLVNVLRSLLSHTHM
ncbi:hypothetical protein TELCIR_07458 [Teladorsagia circumcincta]|uniref:Nuclear pore complex protein n=1 Tax=Teladorsagia circumcincta TaxID=45464 RepID=A0A2G9UKB8_TELCI|nr:hypothetical protein TELCIR_07458 [Teladorsagia circumcincta]